MNMFGFDHNKILCHLIWLMIWFLGERIRRFFHSLVYFGDWRASLHF